jgi:hypothetical protein
VFQRPPPGAQARQLSLRTSREYLARVEAKEREVESGEALARRLQLEEEDAEMAARLERADHEAAAERARIRASREAADAATAAGLVEAEEKAAAEETAKRSAEEKRREGKDRQLAAKMQKKEVEGFNAAARELEESWRAPRIETEETKSGLEISMHLPNVASMEVDLDEASRSIMVRARPKRVGSSPVRRFISGPGAFAVGGLPAAADEPPIEFSVDLRLVGNDVTFAQEDISSRYDDRTGRLSISLKNVWLNSADAGAGEAGRRGVRDRLAKGFRSAISRIFRPAASAASAPAAADDDRDGGQDGPGR